MVANMRVTGERKWIWVDKICYTKQEFESEITRSAKKYDPIRWFNQDGELLVFDGKTYAFSNQQGKEAFNLATNIFSKYPHLQGEVTKSEH